MPLLHRLKGKGTNLMVLVATPACTGSQESRWLPRQQRCVVLSLMPHSPYVCQITCQLQSKFTHRVSQSFSNTPVLNLYSQSTHSSLSLSVPLTKELVIFFCLCFRQWPMWTHSPFNLLQCAGVKWRMFSAIFINMALLWGCLWHEPNPEGRICPVCTRAMANKCCLDTLGRADTLT